LLIRKREKDSTMIKYYLGIIVGALLGNWVGTLEYALLITFISLLMILLELIFDASGEKEE